MTISAGPIGLLPISVWGPPKKKPPPRRQLTAKLDVVLQPEPR
jgi:hypothetical protein